jgi:hypothetical protein
VHLVPVTFTAGTETGDIERTIDIQTDLPMGGTIQCVARGTIKDVPAAAATAVVPGRPLSRQ